MINQFQLKTQRMSIRLPDKFRQVLITSVRITPSSDPFVAVTFQEAARASHGQTLLPSNSLRYGLDCNSKILGDGSTAQSICPGYLDTLYTVINANP